MVDDKRGPGRPQLFRHFHRVSLILPLWLVKKIDARAQKAGTTRSEWIRERLERDAKRKGSP